MVRIYSASTLNEIATQNFNLLISLSFCGFAVGMVLPPLYAAAVVGPYGWRGGMLVLGAFMGNILPCVISASNVNPNRDQPSSKKEKDNNQEQNAGCPQRGREDSWSPEENRAAGTRQQELTRLLKSPEEIDLQLDSERSARYSKTIHQISSVPPIHNDSTANGDSNRSRVHITNILKRSIQESEFYKDPLCNFVVLSTMVYSMTYSGWHAFLIPHALQRGISLQHTIIITLCASVGNLTGRLLTGLLTHRLVKPANVYLFMAIVNVGLLLCYAFVRSFFAMLFLSFLSACAILARSVLPILIIRERASPDKFPIMLAFIDFFAGCGQLLGASLSGTDIDAKAKQSKFC